MKNMFADDVPQSERIRRLQDNADDVVTGKYERPLTEDELNDKKTEFFDSSLQLAELAEEKKAFMAEMKAKTEVVKKATQQLSVEIMRKVVVENGNTYLIRNQDAGMLETYDDRGNMIGERRLKPNERQSTIQASVRAIANG